jgi:methyl-accepting chemotaxis protein
MSKEKMSRLKKKLFLYFILISIVSISISAEIILELGSPAFRGVFLTNMEHELTRVMSKEEAHTFVNEKMDKSMLFSAFSELQVRMILLLLVVGASIIGAFRLFTKDIVSPMESMVNATRRIADGDLSASVPINTQDEIGQIGLLINEMSVNLQDLILQLKSEVDRMRERIIAISGRISLDILNPDLLAAITNRKISKKEIRRVISTGDDMTGILKDMLIDLNALQAFINLYKVFEVKETDDTVITPLAVQETNLSDQEDTFAMSDPEKTYQDEELKALLSQEDDTKNN